MTQHHPTTDRLIDYLHGELAPEEDAALYAHLEACSPCAAAYALEVQLSEMLRNQAAVEEQELPSMVKARIWAEIREAPASPAERLRAWLRPAYALPVAAAVVLAAIFGPAYLHQTQAPAGTVIDAAYYLQDHAAMNSTVPFGDHSGATTSEFETTGNIDQTAVSAVPVVYTADAIH